jgi:hypothetical protein
VVQSAGAVQRDKAASDLEKLTASGAPEYMVLIREVPEGQEPSKWYPVGGLAVPRSSSIDVALSIAIFNNEDDLLKGAFRSYPFLKQSVHKFEYGYRRVPARMRTRHTSVADGGLGDVAHRSARCSRGAQAERV